MAINESLINQESFELNGNSKTNINNVERAISVIGGGTILFLGLKRPSLGGLVLTAIGSGLLHRGITGHCAAYAGLKIKNNLGAESAPVAHDIHVEKSITINKSPNELYAFWRSFENLPRIMRHLESVTPIDFGRSHWVALGPAGKKFEWDAEIYNEKPNELIAWRSLSGSDVVHAGSVRFEAGPPGRGTRVNVVMNYNVTGGRLTALFARLFGAEPGQMIEDDLRRFKQLMEAGEIATIEDQPSGRDEIGQSVQRKASKNASPVSGQTGEADREKTRAHVA
ncbi:MAG TPA: SRPBCC family protein [Pyrinomonadaceae bacterium]